VTLTFDLEILWVSCGCQTHVPAKFHRAKCSGMSYIEYREKKTKTKQSVSN